MNLPNKLTVARMILIVPFVICMTFAGNGPARFLALVIFIIASLTDALDGRLARKNNLVTNFGKFMDPLADKLLRVGQRHCDRRRVVGEMQDGRADDHGDPADRRSGRCV